MKEEIDRLKAETDKFYLQEKVKKLESEKEQHLEEKHELKAEIG